MIARRDSLARVTSTTRLSPSCVALHLAFREVVEARPGQFAMVACAPGLDPLLRRALSLAGVRREGDGSEVELMVKQVGRGTGTLARAREGDEFRALLPLGNGFDLTSRPGERVALVAGGIGLPPLLFAAGCLAAAGVHLDLYLGAATAAELLVVERCRATAVRAGGELVLATDDGSAGEAGTVVAALERRLQGGRLYHRLLACGPDAMLRALAGVARRRGVPTELSLEEPMACGVGVCLGCVVELEDGSLVPSCQEGPVFRLERLAARRWS